MNKPDIIPHIALQDINVKTEPGVYQVEEYGIIVVEQIDYPHEMTLVRLALNVEILQRQQMQLINAKNEADHYIDQTIKLRGQLNHETGFNGLPGIRGPRDGK